MRERNGDASFLFGLMLGIFIGAALALVLTPQSGEAIRNMIAKKVQGARGSAEGGATEAHDKARTVSSS